MVYHSQTTYSHSEELSSLYQEVIVDHFRRPRLKERIINCRFCQEGKNPLCGDVIFLYCQIVGEDKLEKNLLKIYFDGSGCSISQASASIMCELVQNKDLSEIKKIISHAEQIYTGKHVLDSTDELSSDLDALYGVSQFPVRIKCAALPWKTLEYLLAENFDEEGQPKESACQKHKLSHAARKLRIVKTEDGQE